jgi:deoxyribonuclease V
VAGIVIFKFPGMELIEKQYLISPVSFPYVPGLLSFREGPVLLKAFQKIKNICASNFLYAVKPHF